MISKFKQIVSEKLKARLKASGIRGCMAAGAVTAGIAALAVIGGINSDDISTVSLETDVIPEETSASTEAKAEKSVKRTYSHDMEYFSEEDIERIEAEVNKADETETAVEVEETEPAADEAAEVSEEAPEAAYESSEEEADAEAETFDEEVSDSEADAQEADDTDDTAPEAEESTDSVAVRSSAADGDDDGNGLSSALDLEVNDEAADSDEAVAVMSAEEEAPIALMAAPDDADEAVEDESDIPEDITLDDEDSAPEEDAVSLLDVPEWLSFDENGVPTEYVNVLTGNACAYTADPDALMSTGKAVFQGYVAVDPDIIPYGSELYIVAEDGEVYGYAIAADTGYSVRKGHIIVDLFMNEYDDCIQWGNKPVNVYVLK